MENKIRWGILGCGKIARKFAADLRLVKEAVLVAVASRDPERSKQFVEEFGATHVFHNYEDLAKSPGIDIIYIATPHGFHYEHTMLCLQHNKAVLCEKAFALNARQAKEMIDLARSKQVFLMEALWTKFLPQYKKIIELLNTGELGDVKMIQADFGFCAPAPLPQRFYDEMLGGGSILDIGVYPVFMAQSLLGRPTQIFATATTYTSGVDEQCVMTLKFRDGALASLSCSFAVNTPTEAIISGTKGRIHIRNRFHNATAKIALFRNSTNTWEDVEVYQGDGYGYQFEAQHVCDCLLRGLTESPVMNHDDTLSLMETLDGIRKAAGIKYAADEVGAS